MQRIVEIFGVSMGGLRGTQGLPSTPPSVGGASSAEGVGGNKRARIPDINNNTEGLGRKQESSEIQPLKNRKIERAPLPERKDVGGKGLFLNLMFSVGVPVPPFKCVEVSVGKALEQQSIDLDIIQRYFPGSKARCIADIKADICNDTSENKGYSLKQLANLLKDADFYKAIENSGSAKTIRTIYEQLNNGKNEGRPIIVRSSGVAEDSYGDAQAGKYDSEVKGSEDIVATYLKVIASGYANSADSQTKVPPAMPVVMQQCIDCSLGGVAMSYSSLDDNTIQINSAPGQPKAAVSGNCGITPDLHRVNREGAVLEFTPGQFNSAFVLKESADGNGYEEQPVDQEAISHTPLSKKQLAELTGYIKKLENTLMCPVDVEFGIGNDDRLYLVRVRPVTRLRGAMKFDIAPLPDSVMSGQMVGEGFCSGHLYQADAPSSPLEKGNIVVAEQCQDGMLEPGFLEKANGFIFKNGGLNDHVAITMQQHGKPYFVAGEAFQWPEFEQKENPTAYTLACGEFKGSKGAFLWKGDHATALQAGMAVAGVSTDTPEVSNKLSIDPDFVDPVKGFLWLNEQNSRLLEYFAPEKVFDRCLSKKSVISMSMSAKRSEFISALEQETGQFMQDIELLLSGYEKFLSLGEAAGRSEEVVECMADLEVMKQQYSRLLEEAKANLADITRPFGDDELPDQDISFKEWQDRCNSLRDSLQLLSRPADASTIKSFHDIVFLVHSAFIKALPYISQDSAQGELTEINHKVNLIDFMCGNQKASKVDDDLKQVLATLDCNNATVVNVDGALVVNSALGYHQCVIENIDQGDGGKGRIVRLKFSDDILRNDVEILMRSDDYTYGKRRRMLLIALLIEAMSAVKPNVKVSPVTGHLIIEHCHLDDGEKQKEAFLKAASVVFSVRDIDVYKEMNGKSISLSSMIDRIEKGLASDENQQFLKKFLAKPINPDATGRNRFERLPAEYRDVFSFGLLSHSRKRLVNYLQGNYSKMTKEVVPYLIAADPERMVPIITESLKRYESADIFKQALLVNQDVMNYIPKSASCYQEVQDYFFEEGLQNNLVDHVVESAKKQAQLELDSAYGKTDLENARLKKIQADNKNEILAAVQIDGCALKYASDDLKNDPEVVIAAVQNNAYALEYASNKLKNDPKVVLPAVKQYGYVLEHASDELKNNPEVVLAAVRTNGSALEYASDELKNNPEVVLAAVNRTASAWQYASDVLKKNYTVMLAAAKLNGSVLESLELRTFLDDSSKIKDVVLAAVKQNGWALMDAPLPLQRDEEVVLAAVRENGLALQHASWAFRNNEKVVQAAVKQNGLALKHASKRLKANQACAQAAVKNHYGAMQYVGKRLLDNADFYEQLLPSHIRIIDDPGCSIM